MLDGNILVLEWNRREILFSRHGYDKYVSLFDSEHSSYIWLKPPPKKTGEGSKKDPPAQKGGGGNQRPATAQKTPKNPPIPQRRRTDPSPGGAEKRKHRYRPGTRSRHERDFIFCCLLFVKTSKTWFYKLPAAIFPIFFSEKDTLFIICLILSAAHNCNKLGSCSG